MRFMTVGKKTGRITFPVIETVRQTCIEDHDTCTVLK